VLVQRVGRCRVPMVEKEIPAMAVEDRVVLCCDAFELGFEVEAGVWRPAQLLLRSASIS
jgi:hypothetical protein